MKRIKRWLAVVLALTLCVSLWVPGASALETGSAKRYGPEAADGAAFGSWMAKSGTMLGAWTKDSIPASSARTLLNSIELRPQRTGYIELDQKIQAILDTAPANTAYSKLIAAYTWLVKEVTYSWDGYTNTNASVECYNSFRQYAYLRNLTYESGLQKSIPNDMANRTYHVLTKKKGVCYDYAIAFAVIARYVGIDSYVHTGIFTFENTSMGSGHHGWAILDIGGQKYLFDPQRDARNWQYNGKNYYYFAIPEANTWRYDPNAGENKAANEERDASMLSVWAERTQKVAISVKAAGQGTVSGGGSYLTGKKITVTATPKEGYVFAGWYNEARQKVSGNASYSFTVKEPLNLTAKFRTAYTAKVTASPSGTVIGGGQYMVSSQVRLTAKATEGSAFVGWYDAQGNLLGTGPNYAFYILRDTELYALFKGDDLSALLGTG